MCFFNALSWSLVIGHFAFAVIGTTASIINDPMTNDLFKGSPFSFLPLHNLLIGR